MIQEIRKIRPDVPAVIATGYSENFSEEDAEKNNIIFLRKPVEKNLLIKTINDNFIT